MTAAEKPKYANFPERELKVIIGPNINAPSTKTLTRLSIGTYEMSFQQQERGKATADAARFAISSIARAQGLTVNAEKTRDYVCWFTATGAEMKFQVWVTTPFELTQSAHIVWCKYQDIGGQGRTGVSFKLSTGFTMDDILHLLKAAQKNAIVLAEGEAFTIKGNPAPRFQKKAPAAPAATDAAAAPQADAAAPVAEATPSPAPETPTA